jgi:hypothetical protein
LRTAMSLCRNSKQLQSTFTSSPHSIASHLLPPAKMPSLATNQAITVISWRCASQ